MENKEDRGLRQAVYKEMEKCKPKDAAVAAFKHKPYGMDLKER